MTADVAKLLDQSPEKTQVRQTFLEVFEIIALIFGSDKGLQLLNQSP